MKEQILSSARQQGSIYLSMEGTIALWLTESLSRTRDRVGIDGIKITKWNLLMMNARIGIKNWVSSKFCYSPSASNSSSTITTARIISQSVIHLVGSKQRLVQARCLAGENRTDRCTFFGILFLLFFREAPWRRWIQARCVGVCIIKSCFRWKLGIKSPFHVVKLKQQQRVEKYFHEYFAIWGLYLGATSLWLSPVRCRRRLQPRI